MKKIAILLIAILVAGTVMAQEGPADLVYRGGPGFYAGGIFGAYDFKNFAESMNLTPYVGYVFDGIPNLELFGEALVPIHFKEFGMGIILDVGAKYTLGLGFGDLFFGIDFPLFVLQVYKDPITDDTEVDAFQYVGMNFKVGIELEFGFGAQITIQNSIYNGDKAEFFYGIDTFAFYRMDPFLFGASFYIPTVKDGFKYIGMTITPQVEFNISDALGVYGGMPLSGIGVEEGFAFGLFVGAKFTF